MTTTALFSVNQNVHTKQCKTIGTVLGAGAGTGYLLKNGKDIFINGIQERGSELPKKATIPVAGAVSALIFGFATGAGRLIGAGIGKISDTIAQHKAQKEIKEELAETILNNSEIIEDDEPILDDSHDEPILVKLHDEEPILDDPLDEIPEM